MHWKVDAEKIKPYLPEGLEVDLFEGQHKNKWAIEGLSQEKGRLDEVFRSITEGFGNV